ncbi:flagellar motor switch protein FliG [Paracoccus luteus]|uniref:flagellar motor switch protein FliG n=1 Tax=Paracoccus luteus TaxID=2508543 RepID=UPI001070390D|nr:FliG C-terminal domain-containing protein [Paracoccus luteus]
MFMAGPGLTPRQKAAIVVRLMVADGADMALSSLPPDMQALLAQEMATMQVVDRATCDAVLNEFCDNLERVGVTFPRSIDGALDFLGSHLSPDTTNRLRRMAALNGSGDPWDRIAALPPPQLAALSRSEAVEIAAVMLSRLPVARASEVFALLDPGLGRRIALAMSQTGGIEAPALRRIGLALMHAIDALPQPAIDAQPVEKVGALLNFAPATTRDSVLAGLDQDDAEFAGKVRKAIFTWANIPRRIDPRDIPRVLREVDATVVSKAMAGSRGDNAATVDFLLSGLSSRLAESMREEMAGLGRVSGKDAEDAMNEVVATIRRMEAAGELFLIVEAEEDEITIATAQ